MGRDPIDYYAELDIHPSAPQDVIDAAYQRARLSRGSGPDPILDEAYSVLADPRLRASYDVWHRAWIANDAEGVRAEALRRSRREAQRRAELTLQSFRKQSTTAAGDALRNARARASSLQRRRSEQKARAKELPAARRLLVLHPFVAAIIVIGLLGGASAGVYVWTEQVAAREEQERLAAERAKAAADRAEKQARASEAAAAAKEAGRVKKAQAREAAEAAQAARQACVDALQTDRMDFRGCDLSRTDLQGADLSGLSLIDVNFTAANLDGAILDDADITGVNWAGATCPDGTRADPSDGCQEKLITPGHMKRPLKIGQEATIGDWSVTVVSYQANSSSVQRALANYNSEPGDGFTYAIFKVAATYNGLGQQEVAESSLSISINGVERWHADALCHLVDGEGRYKGLNTGQSTRFEECLYLPKEKAMSGVIEVSQDTWDSSAAVTYWAIP